MSSKNMFSFGMFDEMYNGTNKDNGAKIVEALSSDLLRKSLTSTEIVQLFTTAQELKATHTIDEYCKTVGHTLESFADCYEIPLDQLRKWEKEGLDGYSKQMLTYVYLTEALEVARHHTCQFCGTEYYSSIADSWYCPNCEADLLGFMLRAVGN